ncbi:MAG: hypothetical protein RI958_2401 [Actinomycetota bacterium]|jgi:PPOX class probable F420-dependent enzyme
MARLDPAHLGAAAREFVTERHLATLTTVRPDGSPHVVPVGFTFDADRGEVRVITFLGSYKARNAAAGGRAAVCQVDGGRWITFEGTISVDASTETVAEAVAAYAARYRPPKQRTDRVVLRLRVDRVMANSSLATTTEP